MHKPPHNDVRWTISTITGSLICRNKSLHMDMQILKKGILVITMFFVDQSDFIIFAYLLWLHTERKMEMQETCFCSYYLPFTSMHISLYFL